MSASADAVQWKSFHTSHFVVDDGSSCKSSIPLVAGYPAGKENGMVLCILKDVPDNIFNVGQLGCIVREHLGSISWTIHSPSRAV